MRLFFAGFIKKVEFRQAGETPIVELSLCKKEKTKEGAPEHYTWIRATLWKPAEFQVAKLVKGAFIAGSGDMSTRSYDGKDGVKATSIELRCSSFDIEIGDAAKVTAGMQEPPRPIKADHAKAAAVDTDGEPPF